METEIIVALIAFAGSALGTFTGIAVNSRLTNYRLERLEKEVTLHNNFARRMPVVEEQMMQSAGACWSRFSTMERLISIFSGPFSWINCTSPNASAESVV